MRRLIAVSAVLGLLVAAVAAGPVSARTRMDVRMSVDTYFNQDPNAFESSLEGCEWGDTYSVGGAAFPPTFGVFIGYKLFDCYGEGEDGFLVKLNAKFSYAGVGSSGTWTIVDAWGDFAGMTGGGKLVGVPIEGEDAITDNYFGRVTL